MDYIINGSEKDTQRPAKADEYREYIDAHVQLVKEAFNDLFMNPEKPFTKFGKYEGEKLQQILMRLEMAVNMHDVSKYGEEEFDQYRKKFYPTAIEDELMKEDLQYAALVEAEFQMAWFNHFTHNDHHPLFWKYIEKVKSQAEPGKVNILIRNTPREEPYPMSPVAILHMICDWEAMSRKFKTNTADWFREQAQDEKKAMHPNTLKVVTELVEQLFGNGSQATPI